MTDYSKSNILTVTRGGGSIMMWECLQKQRDKQVGVQRKDTGGEHN